MNSPIWQRLWQRIAALFPSAYRWPAMDMRLGDRQLHLTGSIHMGTRNMQPLPAGLLRQLQKADALIVEADITRGGSPFADTADLPPLHTRLDSATLTRLQTLCRDLGLESTLFDTLPCWQIALMLQAHQAQRLGLRPEYGIDYQLLQAAKAADKPVISWWLEAPPAQQPVSLPATFGGELSDTLMRNRNQQWREQLLALPSGRYLVAVGALHLYGDDNLPGLLKKKQT